MAGGSARGWRVTAHVTRAGAVRERPSGALAERPRLTRYLHAAACLGAAGPSAFLWSGEPADEPGPPLQVRVRPSRRLGEGCDVEIRPVDPHEVAGLSTRELQVLTLLACGLTNPAIAVRLNVSRSTAGTHVERVLHKLDAASRAAAAALGLDRDLLMLPVPGRGLTGLAPVAVVRLEAQVRGESVAPASVAARRGLAPRRQPLVIGIVYPSNSDSFRDGQQMLQGAELAVEEVNRNGGIDGRLLDHIAVRADATDASAVRSAVERLVNRDVDAITVGYTFARSRDAIAAQFAPAAAAGSPLLHHSTSTSAARLVADEPQRFGNVFQVCAQENVYGAGFLRTMNELRDSGAWQPVSRRLLVLDSADPNLLTYPERVVDRTERSGWTLTVDHIKPLAPDWDAVIARIDAVDPAAVMIACFSGPQMVQFLRRFHRNPTDALLYTFYTPSVPAFLHEAGPAAEGLLWATVTGRYADGFGDRFDRTFLARYGTRPGMSSAGIHYDVVHLLAATWSQCQSPHNFREVNQLLRRAVHRGVNGPYHLGGANQTNLVYPDETPDASLAQAHLVYQVQDAEHRIISPAPYAAAPFRRAGPSRLKPLA